MQTRQEAVVDEEAFVEREARVTSLEIANAISGDAVTKDEILSRGRRGNRICLHETEARDRSRQRRRREEGPRRRV